tara:strand:+ start:222 stop:614 length:393 start_codon:yes stop_codon:yes gene_type:complete
LVDLLLLVQQFLSEHHFHQVQHLQYPACLRLMHHRHHQRYMGLMEDFSHLRQQNLVLMVQAKEMVLILLLLHHQSMYLLTNHRHHHQNHQVHHQLYPLLHIHHLLILFLLVWMVVQNMSLHLLIRWCRWQ